MAAMTALVETTVCWLDAPNGLAQRQCRQKNLVVSRRNGNVAIPCRVQALGQTLLAAKVKDFDAVLTDNGAVRSETAKRFPVAVSW